MCLRLPGEGLERYGRGAPMSNHALELTAGMLVIATLAGSAAAQSPRAPINMLEELEAALLDCWRPPPIEQSARTSRC